MNKEEVVICHFSSVHPYLDNRLMFKECQSLSQAGYKVRLIARKPDGIPDKVDQVDVIPFPEYKNRFKRILLSPFKMVQMALKQKARTYHFHDPELLPVGVMLKLLGKKVIYDVHENYSQQLLYKPWLNSRMLKWLIAKSFRMLEIVSVLFFNRVVVVSEDIAKMFPAKKTIIVKNFPILSLVDQAPTIQLNKTKPMIFYSGSLSKVRGAKELILSMKYVEPESELWLFGNWDTSAFRQECQSLEEYKYVKYMGFKPIEEVYSYMKHADVALLMMHPIKNYVVSFPVKTFEYLACQVPMVLSDFPLWRETYDGCTLFADPSNPKEIAKATNQLLNDKEYARQLASEGNKRVRQYYSWEAENEKLLGMYRQLIP